MKKHIGLSVAFVMVSILTFAQAQVAIGIKGGPNFAKVDANSSLGENYKSRTGFHGGAFVLVKVGKIGIQPELLFSQQGSKVNFSTTNIDASYDYINVPVILKLYTVAGINLQAGPQFGFLSTGKVKSTTAGITSTQDAKDFIKGSDMSLALGAGWDLPFGLTLDARYNLGLSKINKSSNPNTTKNQVIQVSVGFKLIKIGK